MNCAHCGMTLDMLVPDPQNTHAGMPVGSYFVCAACQGINQNDADGNFHRVDLETAKREVPDFAERYMRLCYEAEKHCLITGFCEWLDAQKEPVEIAFYDPQGMVISGPLSALSALCANDAARALHEHLGERAPRATFFMFVRALQILEEQWPEHVTIAWLEGGLLSATSVLPGPIKVGLA